MLFGHDFEGATAILEDLISNPNGVLAGLFVAVGAFWNEGKRLVEFVRNGLRKGDFTDEDASGDTLPG